MPVEMTLWDVLWLGVVLAVLLVLAWRPRDPK
jgi:hypothetical protein